MLGCLVPTVIGDYDHSLEGPYQLYILRGATVKLPCHSKAVLIIRVLIKYVRGLTLHAFAHFITYLLAATFLDGLQFPLLILGAISIWIRVLFRPRIIILRSPEKVLIPWCSSIGTAGPFCIFCIVLQICQILCGAILFRDIKGRLAIWGGILLGIPVIIELIIAQAIMYMLTLLSFNSIGWL